MTRISSMFALASLLLWQGYGAAKFNIDDSTLYAIKFNPKEESLNQIVNDDETLLNAPGLLQTVTMTTSHNEKYVCELPNDDSKSGDKDDTYEGPSVLQLLERLFVQSK